MKKEINEKTFELNITNELLNLSKSFLWYMDHSPIKDLIATGVWPEFSKQTCLFAIGLTQGEEANPKKGGYDVSINYALPGGQQARMLFLQYKAGIRRKYSNRSGSSFEKSKGALAEHVCFTFNDAAGNTQHSTLRKLAENPEIQENSVLYVFPRITERKDFLKKIGSLLDFTSFVPVKEMDRQASKNESVKTITNDPHKFRVSYDRKTSEVNLLLLLLLLDQGFVGNLLSELISIQIERLFKVFKMGNGTDFSELLNSVSIAIDDLFASQLEGIDSSNVKGYIENVRIGLEKENFVPRAPSNYTTVIPNEGLNLKFDEKLDFSSIHYQVF
ncbi:hypothetical protein [Algoriphagus marincola]|uniref:hypothetical protein n=1 Tax=Algoriphagus marincola TaxID=264027 RepID=UPI00040C63A7|nr:hypothetical protein [Algoriphagus marincola]